MRIVCECGNIIYPRKDLGEIYDEYRREFFCPKCHRSLEKSVNRFLRNEMYYRFKEGLS